MAQELGRLLTLADVADVLEVSVAEAAELVRSGELPAISLGLGTWRVEWPVLRAFIDGKYEEARRRALWEQAEFVDLPEITSGRADQR